MLLGFSLVFFLYSWSSFSVYARPGWSLIRITMDRSGRVSVGLCFSSEKFQWEKVFFLLHLLLFLLRPTTTTTGRLMNGLFFSTALLRPQMLPTSVSRPRHYRLVSFRGITRSHALIIDHYLFIAAKKTATNPLNYRSRPIPSSASYLNRVGKKFQVNFGETGRDV